MALPFLAGRRWPGYSHRRHYISELGAHDAPDGLAVSAAFVAIGSGLLPGVRPGDRGRSIALAGLGGSYVVTGIFRCDPGCPDRGTLSTRQQVHNLAGVAGYGLGILGAAAAARSAARTGERRDAVIAGAVAARAATKPSSRGLHQRALEALLLGWVVSGMVDS